MDFHESSNKGGPCSKKEYLDTTQEILDGVFTELLVYINGSILKTVDETRLWEKAVSPVWSASLFFFGSCGFISSLPQLAWE
jgi:hypothetical protein